MGSLLRRKSTGSCDLSVRLLVQPIFHDNLGGSGDVKGDRDVILATRQLGIWSPGGVDTMKARTQRLRGLYKEILMLDKLRYRCREIKLRRQNP